MRSSDVRSDTTPQLDPVLDFMRLLWSIEHGRHFEHVLCQIDRDRRSIHLGLLLVAWCHPHFAAIMPRKHREESMPSLQPMAAGAILSRRG
jgi:hypothetical protein